MAEKKKPGYVWTGKRWVKAPKTSWEKVQLQKEIDSQSKRVFPYNLGRPAQPTPERKDKAKYPGGEYKPMSSTKPKQTPKPESKSSDAVSRAMTSGPRFMASAGNNKPANNGNNKTDKSRSAPAKTGGGQKKPAVSQSRTMWVKAGETVNGKVVKKGYLAQYGKPEKKVNARVEMVTGPKKGKAVEYSKGRKTKGK